MKVRCFVVIENDGKYLLIQETGNKWDGLWFVPGGKAHKGEEPEIAAIRETFEETAQTVQIEGLFYIVLYNRLLKPKLNLFYTGKIIQSLENSSPAADLPASRWYTYDEIAQLPKRQNLQEVIDMYRKKENSLDPCQMTVL